MTVIEGYRVDETKAHIQITFDNGRAMTIEVNLLNDDRDLDQIVSDIADEAIGKGRWKQDMLVYAIFNGEPLD